MVFYRVGRQRGSLFVRHGVVGKALEPGPDDVCGSGFQPVHHLYSASATKPLGPEDTVSRKATYSCQQHQIIIRLEIPRADHDPSCRRPQGDDGDGHAQQCKCFCDEVTHDDGCPVGGCRCALGFFLPAKERTFLLLDWGGGSCIRIRRSPATLGEQAKAKTEAKKKKKRKKKEVTGSAAKAAETRSLLDGGLVLLPSVLFACHWNQAGQKARQRCTTLVDL